MRGRGLFFFSALLLILLAGVASGEELPFRKALPGYSFRFPQDHFSHEQFETEWWYFVGHLKRGGGTSYGFQLTFFRRALPRRRSSEGRSRWAPRHLYFAHYAISDLSRRRHWFSERLSRGALGEAGASADAFHVWVGDWWVRGSGSGFKLKAEDKSSALELSLLPLKPPALHGREGVSQKGEGAGYASHYYSMTRLKVEGEFRLGGENLSVRGEAWMDHEWGSLKLHPYQEGWDWFGVQLDNDHELMLYIIRRMDGKRDPHSSGTLVLPGGGTLSLSPEDFEVKALGSWRSPLSGATYPMGWRVVVPRVGLDLTLRPSFEAQELDTRKSTRVVYWEGSIRASGRMAGREVSGLGYAEMTGYAGPFRPAF